LSTAEEKDAASASKFSLQKILAVLTGSMTAIGAVCGSAWYLLSPRLDKYIDDHIAAKTTPVLAAQPSSTTILSANDVQVAELKRSIEALSASVIDISVNLTRAKELQQRVEELGKVVTEIKAKANFSATYGYSFRFKGSEIVAQRRPPSRLYFYATRNDEVRVTVYLATQKFPVILVVDGTPVRPTIRDSRDKLRVTDWLVHTSLEEVTAVRNGGTAKEGVPPTIEDPRPENVHYIEFAPEVQFQFGKDDDYDVSGIILVTRKTI
jgi:hypothetical protein